MEVGRVQVLHDHEDDAPRREEGRVDQTQGGMVGAKARDEEQ